jgi:hypothetical protein
MSHVGSRASSLAGITESFSVAAAHGLIDIVTSDWALGGALALATTLTFGSMAK